MELWGLFMELNKNIKKAYEPYCKEFIYCFIIDIFIVISTIVIFITIGALNEFPIIFIIIPLYFIIECFINYRIFLLSRLEIKLSKNKTQNLKINKIKVESSASGWLWNSVIGKLYPKELGVERFKVECVDENNKTITLRMVMSIKKHEKFLYAIKSKPNSYESITYGAQTKIILYFNKQNKCEKFYELNYYF